MASAFRRNTQVVNFHPRAHANPGRRNDREYLLWPAWAYRVVSPRPRERKFDVFQRAVMGLSRAGVTTAKDIGLKLHLHWELVAFIASGLNELGYLTQDGQPTRPGLKALTEETASDAHELSVGYVFQDPWSGELWPRFMERLDYCDLNYSEDGYPRIVLGNRGRPWLQRAFIAFPGEFAAPSPPGPADVLRAVWQHRRVRRLPGEQPSWGEELVEGESPEAVNRVTMVEVVPEPILLATYLYVPHNEDGGDTVAAGGDWFACDPFGTGASPLLRRWIDRRLLDESSPLRAIVDRLMSRSPIEKVERYRNLQAELEADAEAQVARHLSRSVATNKVFSLLAGMERTRQEAVLLGKACPEDKLRHAMNLGRQALEQVFVDMICRFPLTSVWRSVHVLHDGRWEPQQNRDYVRDVYEAAARAVGFASPLPDALARVTPKLVRSVSEAGHVWRLRPLVIATLLTARDRPDHPLRGAAQCDAGLLADIDALATAGGEASHAGPSTLDLIAAEGHIEALYRIVGHLVGTKTASHPTHQP